MFIASSCSNNKDNTQSQWYENRWNMRIPTTSNFTKTYPEFVGESQRDEPVLNAMRCKDEILSK